MSAQTPSPKWYTSGIVNSSRIIMNNLNEISETCLRVFSKANTPIYSGECKFGLPHNVSLSSRVISRDATRSNAILALARVKQEVSTTSKPSQLDIEGSAPSTLPKMPKERVTECFTSICILPDAQAQASSFSSEVGEDRRVYNFVVSTHAKGEDKAHLTPQQCSCRPTPIPPPRLSLSRMLHSSPVLLFFFFFIKRSILIK